MRNSFVCATGLSVLLPWYDWLVARLTQERKTKQHLLSAAQIGPTTRLLDAACGSGTLLQLAVQQAEQTDSFRGQLIGLDIDRCILRQAAAKLARPKAIAAANTQVQLVHGSITALPFGENSFDVVICSLAMHHLESPEKCAALVELHRVLTLQGRLLLADYSDPRSFWSRLKFLPVQMVDGWHATQPHTSAIFPSLLRSTGFTVVHQSLQLETPLGTLRSYVAQK